MNDTPNTTQPAFEEWFRENYRGLRHHSAHFKCREAWRAAIDSTTQPAMELPRDEIISLISPLSNNSADHDIEFAHRIIAALNGRASASSAAVGEKDGIAVAVKFINDKAANYANEYGSDDLGALSFGSGPRAQDKMDYYTGLLELAEELAALSEQQQQQPRFKNTHCSQCGGEFGPGNSGFSHCSDHTPPSAQQEGGAHD